MKRFFARLLTLALTLSLVGAPLGARAADALGDGLAADETVLNEGTLLHSGTYWSEAAASLQQENYVVYAPNERVRPVVTWGGTTTRLTTVAAAAQELEAQGLRVVAGVNGDYYSVAHGVPLGSVMSGGVLRNATADGCAVGFRADGTAILGRPELRLQTLVNGGSGFPIFAYNHVRQSEYGIFLYDSSFTAAHTTFTDEVGVDVLCTPLGGRLSIGETLTLRVDAVLPEAKNTAVAEGQYVLSANRRAYDYYTSALLALQPGDEITVAVSAADEAWNDVTELIGALYPLIADGAVAPDLPAGVAPRTAVGQRADGALILYTVDGRQSEYSAGATLAQVAQRLLELGCVAALSLDGGGSTTLVATMPDATAASVRNRPSEGALRAVTNHLFLVASAEPDGQADHVYLRAENTLALPGASLALTAMAVDGNYIPTDVPVRLSADAGRIENGVLTVPADAARVTVTARCGALRAETAVTVIPSPDAIRLTQDGKAIASLTVAPEETAALGAQAYWQHLAVAGGSECFDWSLDESAGTVDETGVLRATDHLSYGTLRVGCGETAAEFPVTVTKPPLRSLADFENPFASYTTESGEASFSRSTDDAYIRRGVASARLDYAIDAEAEQARMGVNYAVPAGYDRLNLWLYGNGSGETFALETDAGTVRAAALDFTGWRLLSVALPADARRITGLLVLGAPGASGTLYLDRLVLSYDGIADGDAPEVSLAREAEADAASGRVFDAVDGGSLDALRVRLDGKAAACTYDRRTGALRVALPAADGRPHRLSVIAKDQSGNLARAELTIPGEAETEPFFPDAAGHWARDAIDWLAFTGLSNGDGTGHYNPDTTLTRQEFATLVYRYLKPQQDFSAVELPFADAEEIPDWALDAARATHALGILKGAMDADGTLRFLPRAEISRQEAATLLGRLLERGYAAAEAPFDDGAEVAPWAAEYVAVLASLGAFADFATDTFAPAQHITRAEVAAVLYRMN